MTGLSQSNQDPVAAQGPLAGRTWLVCRSSSSALLLPQDHASADDSTSSQVSPRLGRRAAAVECPLTVSSIATRSAALSARGMSGDP
eukprot:scaffold338_cov377-Prasinococcus_capsulatus_cf.AAC.9